VAKKPKRTPSPAGAAAPTPAPSYGGWEPYAYVVALLALTALAYHPTFRADFVRFDDHYYVQENERLRSLDGLRTIWNPQATKVGTQYYPLLLTSFWVEYHLWGLDARGYHATNVALHLANTVLVLLLVRAFGVSPPAALATAAIFALHPAQVESVAWVTERKNILSGFFYLVAFLGYVRHRRTGSRAAYAGSLAAFAAALLSKTQTVTLPFSIAVADWALQQTGQLRRVSVKHLAARLVPLLAVGAVAAMFTIQAENRHIAPPALALVTRLLVAANAAAFYVRLFLAPVGLSPIYPRWEPSANQPLWWIAVALWPLVLAALLRWWRRLGALPTWGILHFFLSLGPVLGLVSFNFFIFSFVAEHFVYLAVIGGGLTVALLGERIASHDAPWAKRRLALAAIALLAIVGCAVQTYREAGYWHDNESFWVHTHARNPNGFGPNWNLGLHYRRIGRPEQALPFFERATEIWPDSDFAFRRYAQTVAKAHGREAAIEACTRKLSASPRFYAAYLERAINRELLQHLDEALQDYARVQNLMRRGTDPWQEAERGILRVRKQQVG
jgi:protein O-mannosyl-transferase